MAAPTHRPSRVVIVDADNPMVEVKGEFFWREDHDAILAAERQHAYQAGYDAGWSSATKRTEASRLFVVRRRRGMLSRVRRLMLAFALLAMLIVALVAVADQLLAQR